MDGTIIIDMRNNKLCLIILVATLTLVGAVYAGDAGFVSTRTLLSVDQLRPGDSFEMAIIAKVAPGVHISGPGKDALYPPNLTLVAPKGVSFDEPRFPEPMRKTFAIMPNQKIPVYEGAVVIRVIGHVAKDARVGRVTIVTKLDAQGCKGDRCFPPEVAESKVSVEIARVGEKVAAVNQDMFAPKQHAKTGNGLAEAGFLKRMATLYVFGLLLAFTPCVYPMIPVTVGYFAGQQDRRGRHVVLLAAVYVLGLALTYSILGALAATTGSMFGSAMQSPVVLIGIAVILIGLALSMFGLYDLKPPAFIHAHASGKDGLLGALVMGLIFGVVAAPCVGPAVLSLLVLVAKIGSPLMGFALFFALSLGIGTPLFFLAAFSAELPVPGAWMVAVKKLAGFLLIGAAGYFVTPILPDWLGRLLIPVVVIAAGVYLGCFEKSLKQNKFLWVLGKVFCVAATLVAVFLYMSHAGKPAISWERYKPNTIETAAKSGRPSMVDFTAKWCSACLELEHGPFSDPIVIEESKRFARFRVDGTQRTPDITAAENKLGVAGAGYPTVLFFDGNGREVKSVRITGYVDSAEILKRMRSVK